MSRYARLVFVLFGLCALACGAGAPPVLPPPGRAVCYAAADMRAQERADVECRLGDTFVPFSECPAYDSILAELQRAQESCP